MTNDCFGAYIYKMEAENHVCDLSANFGAV